MKMLLAMLLASVLLLYGCTQNAGNAQNAVAAGQADSGAGNGGFGATGNADAGSTGAGSNNAAGAGTGADVQGASGSGTVKEFTVEASDWQFSPSTITVNKGDTVRITLVNKDVSHGIAISEFGFSLKADAGQTATGEFVASKVGTYTFFCNVFCGEGHREMTGTLVVK